MDAKDLIRIQHMRDYAQGVIQLSESRARADLDSDVSLAWALTFGIGTIGEAASRVSQETRQKYPQIDWRPAIATRNFLFHGYDAIDYDIL